MPPPPRPGLSGRIKDELETLVSARMANGRPRPLPVRAVPRGAERPISGQRLRGQGEMSKEGPQPAPVSLQTPSPGVLGAPSRLRLQARELTWRPALDQVMSALGAAGLLCVCAVSGVWSRVVSCHDVSRRGSSPGSRV